MTVFSQKQSQEKQDVIRAPVREEVELDGWGVRASDFDLT